MRPRWDSDKSVLPSSLHQFSSGCGCGCGWLWSVVWSASENGRSGAHGARDVWTMHDTSPRKHGFCSSMHLSHRFDLVHTVDRKHRLSNYNDTERKRQELVRPTRG